MNNCIIVIPIYKVNVSINELASIRQCCSVLNRYKIVFIAPNTLKFGEWYNEFSHVDIIRFEDLYFSSVETYNDLCLQKIFYETFKEKGYEYLLVYQMDAFVFEDRLQEFIEMNYDYIGAPWIEGKVVYGKNGYKVLKVGNGGLSLRNINGCLKAIGLRNELDILGNIPEDMFFSYCENEHFSVAPVEVALQFSFEKSVSECYELNHKNLPFGCHAWERYDFDFWDKIIEKYRKIERPTDFCGGHEDYYECIDDDFNRKLLKLFDSKDGVRIFKEKVKRFKGKNKLFVFGCGYYGHFFSPLFNNCGILIDAYVDNDCSYIGRDINGVLIVTKDALPVDSSIIICSRTYHKEISKELIDMKIKKFTIIDNLLPEND